jgi:hypothetical protein
MSALITRWFNGTPASASAAALAQLRESGGSSSLSPAAAAVAAGSSSHEPDLTHLVKMLTESLAPLLSLAKLSAKPHIGQVTHVRLLRFHDNRSSSLGPLCLFQLSMGLVCLISVIS